jgi:hypothetical protein
MIVKELNKINCTIHKSTVAKLLKKYDGGDGNQAINLLPACKNRKSSVCTPGIVKKVKSHIASDNPPSIRTTAKRVGVSTTSVHNIIHRDLKHHKKRKTKVHHLTAATIA